MKFETVKMQRENRFNETASNIFKSRLTYIDEYHLAHDEMEVSKEPVRID